MKKNYIFILFTFVTIFAANGQQSLFNVPSSEITKQKGFFLQEQLNFNDIIQSNLTLDWGLGKGWEIGTNIVGVDYSLPQKKMIDNDAIEGEAYAPLVLLNIQKGVTLSEHFKVGIGTQNGFNVTQVKNPQFAHFSFVNVVTSFHEDRIHLTTGYYHGNTRYLGEGNSSGPMLGAEATIIPQKLSLMADWIHGNHDLGVSVVGFVWYPTKRLPLSFGWQTPNQENGNASAFVFEITLLPR